MSREHKIPWNNFGAVDRELLDEKARNPRDPVQPLALRLMFLAMGRCNLSGHTPLGPGELAGFMEVELRDKKGRLTGEIVTPSSASLSNAIRRAVDEGLLSPGSGLRCLVVPEWFIKAGGKGGHACKTHGIRGR